MSALLESLRESVAAGRPPTAGARAELVETADPSLVRRAGRLLTGLVRGDLPSARVAVLSASTIGPYEQLLRASLAAAGVFPDLVIGAHGSLERDLATGDFARLEPPQFVTALLDESSLVPRDWAAQEEEVLAASVRARLADLGSIVGSALGHSSATLVLNTVPLPAELRDGLVSWRARTRLTRLWYEVNGELLALAEEHDRVETIDLAGLLADAPAVARDDRLHRYGDMPYTDGALLLHARQVRRIVQARMGLSRKVLALDLDGTLWGGVLGEVGAGGVELGGLYPGNCYLALQRTVRRLRDQGVILMLASKNDAELVESALTDHPEMLLRSGAFTVRAVNWSSKAENLRQAADSLALPLSSFVFMDDSAFEREEVRSRHPEVAVVSASGDPAHLVRSLLGSGWFDVTALTGTDRRRADLYQARAERAELAGGFGAAEDYLRALGIEVEIAPVTEFTVGRVAQLAARTNQFNLTGVRFDEAATASLSADPAGLVAAVTVSDKFGSEGIVGALWVDRGPKVWRVLNLVLSCRVLGRGIEFAIAGWLAGQAREHGAEAVSASFVPSGRNGMATGFWVAAGFTAVTGDEHVLDLSEPAADLPAWIKLRERSVI